MGIPYGSRYPLGFPKHNRGISHALRELLYPLMIN